jgi:pimeloyl-ACP methyl ester carboxylesterase
MEVISDFAFFKNSKKVKLQNGITIEYCIHTISYRPNFTITTLKKTKKIILVMGYASPQEEWKDIVSQLSKKWSRFSVDQLEILTFNNRGVGNSSFVLRPYSIYDMANDLYLLLVHLKWKKIHLIGMSMGGMIAMEFTYHYPEYISSLTLIATTRGGFKPNLSKGSPIWRLCTNFNPLLNIHYTLLSMFPSSYLETKLPNGQLIYDILYKDRLYIHSLFPSSISGLIGHFIAIIRHYISDERLYVIKNYRIPMLIIGAEDDDIIPIQETMILRNLLNNPSAKTIIYKKSGHGILSQHAKDISMEIIKLILVHR